MNIRTNLVASLILLGCSWTLTAADRLPNFVIIMTDDMGYADLSCYGNDRFQTPHLDRLAAEGLRLTDYHSNGAVCSPTRAALVTGRYQQRTGVVEVVKADPAAGFREKHGLPSDEQTFAELLTKAGYRTALFGKWHLGYAPQFNPTRHGFQEFRGYVSGNIDYHTHVDQAGFFDWWNGAEQQDETGYSTHLINRHAVRFIEQNADAPFCMYVAHEAVHAPYQGPDDPPIRSIGHTGVGKNSPEHVRRAYREMTEAVDDGVGEIVTTLKRLKLDRDTLIIFCSDNGGTAVSNNGPLKGTKGTLWEGGHRVPGIFWWPGKIKPGVNDTTVMSMDVLPTLLELANVEVPTGLKLDGQSLVPLLLDGKPLGERTLFWSYGNQLAVRRGPWKLVIDGRVRQRRAGSDAPPAQLYRLDEDLSEQRDIAADHPDVVAELTAARRVWQQDVARTSTP